VPHQLAAFDEQRQLAQAKLSALSRRTIALLLNRLMTIAVYP
jgi:hypothetical protein